jgi:hypothetical protein
MAASVAGCMLLDRGNDEPSGPAFSHRVHADVGVDCTDCHAGVEDSDEPGMPRLQACQLCHTEIDADKPAELKAESFFTDGVFRAAHASAVPEEVVFSHAAHVGRGTACADCHRGIETSDRIGGEQHFAMQRCMDCHAAAQAPNTCEVCHSVIREDWEPPSHFHNWKRLHGQTVRADTDMLVDRCELCHSESSCVACHRDEPPASHNNFWRLRGHGIAASMDRDSCSTCHEPDSCEQCHQEVLPQSHQGMWGAPKDTHCLTCHFPLKSNGCVACHKGTPSHALATPKPPDHTPGMNCRQCHGVTQPLPHVDKGDDCNMCHL